MKIKRHLVLGHGHLHGFHKLHLPYSIETWMADGYLFQIIMLDKNFNVIPDVNADISYLPFADSIFDYVTVECVGWIDEKMISEMVRVSKFGIINITGSLKFRKM